MFNREITQKSNIKGIFEECLALMTGVLVFCTPVFATQNVSIPTASVQKFSPPASQEMVKRFGKSFTLKINQDLFDKGVELQAQKYGHYFANFEASNLLQLKHKNIVDKKTLQGLNGPSAVTGGLRLGGLVKQNSKVFLKVGYESEHVGGKNMLSVPGSPQHSLGVWRTAIQPGIGFEHKVSDKVSLLGELKTTLMPVDERSSHYTSRKPDSRNNTVLFGVKYRLGE